jgi:2',3'-cyclic-nucleotide 2'-phosphodiesterase
MKVLFIGDVFGACGRRVLANRLRSLRTEHTIDVCIANGENAAGGIGISENIFGKLRKYGVDVVSGGNHSLAHAANEPSIMDQPMLLRPHNMPPGNPGHGTAVFGLPDGRSVGVLCLQGRTFFNEVFDCPFRAAQTAVAELRIRTPLIVVDIHAEATSEKIALARHLDGSVSAVIGTHTHVQTADERVLPGGTAFITDAGMTGPEDSVIGMKSQLVIRRFLFQGRVRLEPANSGPLFNGVVIDIDDQNGRARGVHRIFERMN